MSVFFFFLVALRSLFIFNGQTVSNIQLSATFKIGCVYATMRHNVATARWTSCMSQMKCGKKKHEKYSSTPILINFELAHNLYTVHRYIYSTHTRPKENFHTEFRHSALGPLDHKILNAGVWVNSRLFQQTVTNFAQIPDGGVLWSKIPNALCRISLSQFNRPKVRAQPTQAKNEIEKNWIIFCMREYMGSTSFFRCEMVKWSNIEFNKVPFSDASIFGINFSEKFSAPRLWPVRRVCVCCCWYKTPKQQIFK